MARNISLWCLPWNLSWYMTRNLNWLEYVKEYHYSIWQGISLGRLSVMKYAMVSFKEYELVGIWQGIYHYGVCQGICHGICQGICHGIWQGLFHGIWQGLCHGLFELNWLVYDKEYIIMVSVKEFVMVSVKEYELVVVCQGLCVGIWRTCKHSREGIIVVRDICAEYNIWGQR